MTFRTELHPDKLLDLPITASFVSIGSCFANTMGTQLHEYKFTCLTNPFGVIYNPVSIFRLLKGDIDLNSGMVESQDIWYHDQLHSDFRSSHKDALQQTIETTLSTVSSSLSSCTAIIITLGTAFVYKRIDTDTLVANCHKIPQSHFNKEMLSSAEIIAHFDAFFTHLTSINKEVKVILTVSPVRHIKDTIAMNTVSKAHLRVACDELQRKYVHVHYFPAFELMIDDLRDYRFYKDDFLHPTSFAENYIWEKFIASVFNSEAQELIAEWKKIKIALDHKPFNADSKSHQSFLRKQLMTLEKMSTTIDCKEEIELVLNQLL